jgi:hypothetical protein
MVVRPETGTRGETGDKTVAVPQERQRTGARVVVVVPVGSVKMRPPREVEMVELGCFPRCLCRRPISVVVVVVLTTEFQEDLAASVVEEQAPRVLLSDSLARQTQVVVAVALVIRAVRTNLAGPAGAVSSFCATPVSLRQR